MQFLFPDLTSGIRGIASHANNIGPIAVFLLLLLIWKPYHWRILNILCLIAALLSLLLSQSKTAWIACFVAFLVLFGYRTINVIRGISAGKNMSFTHLAAVCAPFFLSFFLVVGLTIGVEYGGYSFTEVDSRI